MQSYTLGQRNTLAYTIAMFQFDHYAVLNFRIHPSATFSVRALVEFSRRQSWICLDGQVEGSTGSEIKYVQAILKELTSKGIEQVTKEEREHIHGKTYPTQTKVHSEQCPSPLMEAAQLVSKALHGPRELLPLHHLEALEDSSQKAVTCRQGNLQDYPEG